MNIVFFGSAEIAVPSLQALINCGHRVVLVVTTPDSRKGRGYKLSASAVKRCALENGIALAQPASLKNEATKKLISDYAPDFFVVFAYGKILPKALLSMPQKCPLNIHASLLPRYRGAAPVQWALLNGDAVTGVTIMRMNEGVDEGDILLQESIKIEYGDDAVSLQKKLAALGAELIDKTIELISSGEPVFIPQDDKKVTYAPKLTKKDGEINWGLDAESIRNRVRACLPWPGAYTHHEKKMLKIWKCEVSSSQTQPPLPPGTVQAITKNGIVVSTANNYLVIKELQFENAKKLSAWDFVQGHHLKIGDRLG